MLIKYPQYYATLVHLKLEKVKPSKYIHSTVHINKDAKLTPPHASIYSPKKLSIKSIQKLSIWLYCSWRERITVEYNTPSIPVSNLNLWMTL